MSIGSTTTSVPETTRSPAPMQSQPQQQLAPGSSPLPPAAQTQPQQPQFPPGVKLDMQRPPSVLQQQPPQPPQQQQQQQTAQRNGVPSLLSDLVVPFENVKQKGERVSSDLVLRKEMRCDADLRMYSCCFRREQRRTVWRTWTKYTSCSMEGTRTYHSRRTPRSECTVLP
jgi:hypothetical protein